MKNDEALDAMSCPNCGGQNAEISHYDYGMDPQTGYVDAGTMCKCLACGQQAEIEDWMPRVTE